MSKKIFFTLQEMETTTFYSRTINIICLVQRLVIITLRCYNNKKKKMMKKKKKKKMMKKKSTRDVKEACVSISRNFASCSMLLYSRRTLT